MAERSWYIADAGLQDGPFPESEFRTFLASGRVTSDTLVWTAGMSAWQRAADIPGLMASGRTPPPVPLPGGPAWPAPPASIVTDFGVWSLLGRSLLATLGVVLIIPAPWAMTSFYRWFISHLRARHIQRLGFSGQPGDIWWVFVLTALCGYAGVPHIRWLPLVLIPFEAILSWLVIRWVVANIMAEGRSLSMRFAGSVWGYIGWTLFLAVSTITIIGWAWVAAAMMRWTCRNIDQATLAVSFNARGWQILWRSFVFGLTVIFIIPIPWTLHWFVRWYVSQFSVGEKAV